MAETSTETAADGLLMRATATKLQSRSKGRQRKRTPTGASIVVYLCTLAAALSHAAQSYYWLVA